GGTLPAVLNAADEVAVKGFLQGRIGFDKITEVVERVMERHHNTPLRTLQDVIAADRWAREEAEKAMEAI
ncbi:MAG: 1-deoxy-D-xylulose-5-phosphate reductoisomerase, partial [Deltaproteobacteria bacterium]